MKALHVLAVSLVVVAAFSWYLVYQKNMEITGLAVYDSPALSTENYAQSELRLDDNTISLISGCKKLTMVADERQIISIKNGAKGKIDFRPTSHDLAEDILGNFGIEVLKVKIENLQDGAYFANLVLRQDDRFFVVDSRPSDAIALAVRSDAPIYVKNSLMDEFGEDVC
jgi:bifunctional DNase/RNase